MASTNHTEAQKAEAARLAVGKDGRAIAKIAKRMGVAPTTVYWWRKRYAGTPEAVSKHTGVSVAGDELNGAAPATFLLLGAIMAIEAELAKLAEVERLPVIDFVRSRLVK